MTKIPKIIINIAYYSLIIALILSISIVYIGFVGDNLVTGSYEMDRLKSCIYEMEQLIELGKKDVVIKYLKQYREDSIKNPYTAAFRLRDNLVKANYEINKKNERKSNE
mgnify:CR=1 FL=1